MIADAAITAAEIRVLIDRLRELALDIEKINDIWDGEGSGGYIDDQGALEEAIRYLGKLVRERVAVSSAA